MVTPVVWLDDRATVALGVVLAATAGWNVHAARGSGGHARRLALRAALLLGAALVLGGVVRLALGADAWLVGLVAYDAALVVVVGLLLAGSTPARMAQLRDLVIDLGDTREHPSRQALARTLRDRDLVVATWDPDRSAYLTAEGEPVPAHPAGRGTTRLDRDGQPYVLLVHDAALEGDPRWAEALAAAARLDAVNAEWQDEVSRQAQQLADSRRRLLAAADDERRRLSGELGHGVGERLDDLAATLAQLDARPGSHLERALRHLLLARTELDGLAAGLRPRGLEDGLAAAVTELAATVPVDVTVTHDLDRLGPDSLGDDVDDVELAAYYVCAEALVNAVKHAPGAGVTIDLRVGEGLLTVRVADEGPGGAHLTGRGGLLGLRDRVEALGGRLEVSSGAAGTRVVAELPLGHP